MGEPWVLVAGRFNLLAGRNEVPPDLMTMFSKENRYVKRELITKYESIEEVDHSARLHNLVGYRSNVKQIRNRLDLMGYSREAVWDDAINLLADAVTDEDRMLSAAWSSRWLAEIGTVEDLLHRTVLWARESDGHWRSRSGLDKEDGFYAAVWEELTDLPVDPRFLVALLVEGLRGNAAVRLDLTNLAFGGWLDWKDDLVENSAFRLQHETGTSGKIIVVPEGSTDSRIMRAALDVARPDIADFFSFMDFEGSSAPGGTDRVVSLTKGLAGAGVMNRVVAVLDNDAAGRDAERILQRAHLPNSFQVVRLPSLRFARRYPTLGPSGHQIEDVNGRAVSVEFMLGDEILRRANNGVLPPVRWRNYLNAVGDYQGSLEHKDAVQRAIEEALSAPKSLPVTATKGLAALASALVDAAERCT